MVQQYEFMRPHIEAPYDKLPAEVQRLQLWATAQPKHWPATSDDFGGEEAERLYKIDHASRYPLRKIPLIVLSQDMSARTDEHAKIHDRTQQAMAQYSERGKQIVVKGAGHHIQLEQPEVVIDAIGQVLAPGQSSGRIRVSVHVPDSVAHVVDREQPDRARFAIVSSDGQAQLLLMDTTIVAQMTDRGLARVSSRENTDSIKGTGSKIVARMVLGALTPLLDHGIAYHLRDLADARYANGRLLLLGRNGDEVFRDVEFGKGPLMESFSADDARAFAAKARAARAQLGR
jgi:hypothetical protein